MSMTYLRNTWYVAAWSEQIRPGELVTRRILGEPIVMFRKEDGTIAAMADVCSHRFAPLHAGKLLPGDRLQCPYHGLQYGPDGVCVHNPHGKACRRSSDSCIRMSASMASPQETGFWRAAAK